MRTTSLRTGGLAALTITAAFGHFTWVAAPAPFVAGKAVKIMVAHGDLFPHGDEAINAAQLKLAVLSASGARTELKPAAVGAAVLADFTPREAGPHRVVFTQDRGVMSRTPKGVKPGGRDRNPTATEAFALIRTGVAYIGPSAGPAAAGLDLEITAQFAAGAWQLRLLRNGKPLAGETVQVLLKEQETGAAVGKTGADGRLVYTPGPEGPALFLCDVKEKAEGLDYRTLSTSTYVTW